jgi:hypothetical protein
MTAYEMRPIAGNRQQITDEDGTVIAVVRADLGDAVLTLIEGMERPQT